jgi:hypothetical protein
VQPGRYFRPHSTEVPRQGAPSFLHLRVVRLMNVVRATSFGQRPSGTRPEYPASRQSVGNHAELHPEPVQPDQQFFAGPVDELYTGDVKVDCAKRRVFQGYGSQLLDPKPRQPPFHLDPEKFFITNRSYAYHATLKSRALAKPPLLEKSTYRGVNQRVRSYASIWRARIWALCLLSGRVPIMR